MSDTKTLVPPRSRDTHQPHTTASPRSQTPPGASVEEPVKEKPGFNRKPLLYGVGALVVALGSYFFFQSYLYVSTDNAEVQGHATLLSSQVKGIISRAAVEENQKVKAGQVLIEIKQDDYENALEQKQDETASLEAQFKGAERSYLRTLDLFKKGASTKERLDAAEAQYKSFDSRLKEAQAEVAQAQLNLGYTKILAPADGKVGRKAFEVGMLASPGQPLLGFVANDERWVTANLKETDMANITEGKPVYVTVDAIPGREFEGVVDSISPATGASFTLLPPDNATGNFTKVVQRVPVKIKLLKLTEQDMDRLQNGLSADVKIKVH